MEWKEFASWMFFGGWSLIGLYVANSIKELSNSVSNMKDSMNEQNTNIAVMVEKMGNHEKRIERLESCRE